MEIAKVAENSSSNSSDVTSVVLHENRILEKRPPCPSKKRILDEETYTKEMERIITRDFFPSLNKLRAQNEYLEALENNDMVKVQEIQFAYRPRVGISRCSSLRGIFNTPSTFETPIIDRNASPSRESIIQDDVLDLSTNKGEKCLDKFLAGSTSEDNASFEVIMEKSAIQHQQKYPWLYKNEEEEQRKVNDMLALPSTEKNAIENKQNDGLVTWAYKNKNALMYVPDGAELTLKEKLLYEKRQEIHHGNTRFVYAPFDEQANKAAIAEAASVQAKMKEGKVGIDGKEIIPDESPQVNGYGFVGTPSPSPGVTDSPIMTWGEIEGTPFRLDGSDTPLPQNPSGQQFKIPDISARERLGLALADKAAKKHRKRKQEAMKHVHSTWLTPSPKFGSSSLTPLERLHSMSPAAQKLARAKLGIHRDTDTALRASYSPSPAHTPLKDRTPEIAEAHNKTPSTTPCQKSVHASPVADDMLHFPSRKTAKDFF